MIQQLNSLAENILVYLRPITMTLFIIIALISIYNIYLLLKQQNQDGYYQKLLHKLGLKAPKYQVALDKSCKLDRFERDNSIAQLGSIFFGCLMIICVTYMNLTSFSALSLKAVIYYVGLFLFAGVFWSFIASLTKKDAMKHEIIELIPLDHI